MQIPSDFPWGNNSTSDSSSNAGMSSNALFDMDPDLGKSMAAAMASVKIPDDTYSPSTDPSTPATSNGSQPTEPMDPANPKSSVCDEKKKPWYRHFVMEGAKIGLTIAASAIGGILFPPFGAFIAGGLTSAGLSYWEQKKCEGKVRASGVLIDGLIGMIPGGLGKMLVEKFGTGMAARAAGTTLKDTLIHSAVTGAIDGAAVGFGGEAAQSGYESYRDTGHVDIGKAVMSGLKSAVAGAIGGGLVGGSIGGIERQVHHSRLAKARHTDDTVSESGAEAENTPSTTKSLLEPEEATPSRNGRDNEDPLPEMAPKGNGGGPQSPGPAYATGLRPEEEEEIHTLEEKSMASKDRLSSVNPQYRHTLPLSDKDSTTAASTEPLSIYAQAGDAENRDSRISSAWRAQALL